MSVDERTTVQSSFKPRFEGISRYSYVKMIRYQDFNFDMISMRFEREMYFRWGVVLEL